MPRYAVTSNLKDFPNSALVEASALIEQVALSDDEVLAEAQELVINYNPETQNVFVSDSKFNVWYLGKYANNLIMHRHEEPKK